MTSNDFNPQAYRGRSGNSEFGRCPNDKDPINARCAAKGLCQFMGMLSRITSIRGNRLPLIVLGRILLMRRLDAASATRGSALIRALRTTLGILPLTLNRRSAALVVTTRDAAL